MFGSLSTPQPGGMHMTCPQIPPHPKCCRILALSSLTCPLMHAHTSLATLKRGRSPEDIAANFSAPPATLGYAGLALEIAQAKASSSLCQAPLTQTIPWVTIPEQDINKL
eukprot:722186-Pelagomonas_calceolata.AAC.1